MADNIQKFIDSYMPYALDIQQKYGIPHQVTLAIAANDTGWGATTMATKYNNPFGIKASGGGGTAGYTPKLETWEEGPQGKYTIKDTFNAYKTPADSFEGFAKLVTNDYYKKYGAGKPGMTPSQWAQALKNAGYATDKQWVPKLNNIMGTINERTRHGLAAPLPQNPGEQPPGGGGMNPEEWAGIVRDHGGVAGMTAVDPTIKDETDKFTEDNPTPRYKVTFKDGTTIEVRPQAKWGGQDQTVPEVTGYDVTDWGSASPKKAPTAPANSTAAWSIRTGKDGRQYRVNELTGETQLVEGIPGTEPKSTTFKDALGNQYVLPPNDLQAGQAGPPPAAQLVFQDPTADLQRSILEAQLANTQRLANGSPWERAKTQAEIDRAMIEQEQQNIRTALTNQVNMMGNLNDNWVKALPYAAIPGQQYFLGAEPGGVMENIAKLSGRSYNPETFRAPIMNMNLMSPWDLAKQAIPTPQAGILRGPQVAPAMAASPPVAAAATTPWEMGQSPAPVQTPVPYVGIGDVSPTVGMGNVQRSGGAPWDRTGDLGYSIPNPEWMGDPGLYVPNMSPDMWNRARGFSMGPQ